MAFGLNRAEVIGRLGADVTVNHLTNGRPCRQHKRGDRRELHRPDRRRRAHRQDRVAPLRDVPGRPHRHA